LGRIANSKGALKNLDGIGESSKVALIGKRSSFLEVDSAHRSLFTCQSAAAGALILPKPDSNRSLLLRN
jgi:hypothetical protein